MTEHPKAKFTRSDTPWKGYRLKGQYDPLPETIVEELLSWLAQGKTLADFCKQPGKPSRDAIQDWKRKDPEFEKAYYRAKDFGYDALAEQALEIADTPSSHRDDVQHRKLQVWARIMLLERWCPTRYGVKQKVQNEVLGQDQAQISDTERVAKIQALLAVATTRIDSSQKENVKTEVVRINISPEPEEIKTISAKEVK